MKVGHCQDLIPKTPFVVIAAWGFFFVITFVLKVGAAFIADDCRTIRAVYLSIKFAPFIYYLWNDKVLFRASSVGSDAVCIARSKSKRGVDICLKKKQLKMMV